MIPTEQLDAAFDALSHSARPVTLSPRAREEATAIEFTEPFETDLPAVSRHIRVLEGAGLIRRRQDARLDRMEAALKSLKGDST